LCSQEQGELSAAKTIPDSSIKCCEVCLTRFTVLLRRHRCRNCDKIGE
jgi:hypothetical protein